jgi:SAM-dependent methyltransferase
MTSFGFGLIDADDCAKQGRKAISRNVVLTHWRADIRLRVAEGRGPAQGAAPMPLGQCKTVGQFETTVDFYRFREPYPAEFFKNVAGQLGLTRETRLLDVGCGPGNLVIGFAPFVGRCTAIDVEPGMLRAATQAAAQVAMNVEFRQTAVQDLAAEDSYDFVTIGRALHWLPREETLAVFEQVVAPGGSIATCGSTGGDLPGNKWMPAYKRVRSAWSTDPSESRYKIDMDQWFAPSRFRKAAEIRVPYKHRVTIEDLIRRALSYSTSSPAVVGERRPQFEDELRAALEPFAQDGAMDEELTVIATVFG